MQHLDDDIDLALDDTPRGRHSPIYYLAVTAAGLLLAAAFGASAAGELTLESRSLPIVISLLAALGIIAAAFRRPAN